VLKQHYTFIHYFKVLSLSGPQHQNFEESQEAMKQQLLQLSLLMKALDPGLLDYLGKR
jgi:hypothetical protein